MSSDAAELSSIQGSLEDLARRIETIAKRHDTDPDDPVAAPLFEVERALHNATRRLDRLRQKL